MPDDALLAIDPGLSKWGIALVARSGECLFREVLPPDAAIARIEEIAASGSVGEILLGDRTGSKAAQERLRHLGEAKLIPEDRTTLIARDLYWRENPPRGWRRLVPRGLLFPPVPLDGYAAQALALRRLGILD
jgi:hypothetical protein